MTADLVQAAEGEERKRSDRVLHAGLDDDVHPVCDSVDEDIAPNVVKYQRTLALTVCRFDI